MRAVAWAFWLVVILLVGSALHYVLPKRAMVYVNSTENRIVSAEEYNGFRSLRDATPTDGTGRLGADVFFINTTRRDGGPLVFRNEDTGLGFPPYFKFDSADLQAEAENARSTQEAPRWVVVRYYGWRIPFISMFPNATSLREAADPDARLIPWLSIVVFALFGAVIWAVRSRWLRWRRRRADPVAASWQGELDRKGWRGWLGR